MNIFIAYARADRDLADSIALRVRAEGHRVFFDRDGVRTGDPHDAIIRREIARSDFLIFIASPDSLEPESYALAELAQFRTRYPAPEGRLLSVLTQGVTTASLTPYARSVSIPEPSGDPVAFYSAEAIGAIRRLQRRRIRRSLLALVLVLVAVGGAAWLGAGGQSTGVERDGPLSLVASEGVIARLPDPRAAQGDLFRVRASVELEGVGSAQAKVGFEFEDDDYLPLGDFDYPDPGLDGPPGKPRSFIATFRLLHVPTASELGLLDIPSLRWRIYALGPDGESVGAASAWFEWAPNALELGAATVVERYPSPLFERLKVVIAIPEGGFAVGLSNPARVGLLAEDGAQTELATDVAGTRITCLAATHDTLFVGLAAPATVLALDPATLDLRWSEAVPALALEHEWGTEALAIEPRSMGWSDEGLWVATAGGSAEAGLLLRSPDGSWHALDNYDTFVISPEDTLLRPAAGGLWSVQTNVSPGAIALLRESGPIAFGGHDHELIADLSDLAADWLRGQEQAAFLACGSSGGVTRVQRTGERLELVAPLVLPIDGAESMERWAESRVAVLGDRPLVATSSGAIGTLQASWTQVRLAEATGQGSARVLQRAGAGIRSIAASPRAGVVVLALTDGSTEAYRIEVP